VATLSWPVHRLALALEEEAGLGAELELRCWLPEGTDPPTWTPDAATMGELLGADLILANGSGYEAWLATASLPAERLVLSSREVPPVHREERRHQHGSGPAHSHGSRDPHTWVAPSMAALQVDAIAASWTAQRPDWAPRLSRAAEAVGARLRERETRLGAAFARLEGRALAANHPSHGHLARVHGLQFQVFDLDPGEQPPAEVVRAVENWVTAASPAPLLLWESAPEGPVVAALPSALQHVVFDTLESPVRGDAQAELDGRIDANIETIEALAPATP
jgi:ABC-type Zn uptake system ZnuABC Zn-binding protein ZnuA